MQELMNILDDLSKDPNLYTRTASLNKELMKHGIELECINERNIGNCYNSLSFQISSEEELPDSFVLYLRKIGLFGYGQEFWFEPSYQRDGKFIIEAESRCDSSG